MVPGGGPATTTTATATGGARKRVKSATGSAARDEDGAKEKGKEEDWTRTRKDNHKEVERRRRETINEGINELKLIVPGCEKNKGSILQRAVEYIRQLKQSEASNIEKWTLESLLLQQSMAELRAENDALRAAVDRLDRVADENARLRDALAKAAGTGTGTAGTGATGTGAGDKRRADDTVGDAGPKRARLAE